MEDEVSAGGVAPTEVDADAGDLRELELRGSAECWRLSYFGVSQFQSERMEISAYLDSVYSVCQFARTLCQPCGSAGPPVQGWCAQGWGAQGRWHEVGKNVSSWIL